MPDEKILELTENINNLKKLCTSILSTIDDIESLLINSLPNSCKPSSNTETIYVALEFAKPNLKVIYHLGDIQSAVYNVQKNLLAKYNITIGDLFVSNNQVIICMSIPKDSVEKFSVGNHLKGISRYLLHQCSFPYYEYLDGTRLLHYYKLNESKDAFTDLMMSE